MVAERKLPTVFERKSRAGARPLLRMCMVVTGWPPFGNVTVVILSGPTHGRSTLATGAATGLDAIAFSRSENPFRRKVR